MNINNSIEFYCLNYNNPERKESMINRFKKLDMSCYFYHGVDKDDTRVKHLTLDSNASSCMYGHLDMIHHFYHTSNKPYGIFCEDDILIHKDFKKFLPQIIEEFEALQLDVLLLGYLVIENINTNFIDVKLKKNIIFENENYYIYTFPNEIWGAQMYLLSRENAKKLLDKYYVGYAEKTLYDKKLTPFSSDWTITKDGNRALVYPILVIENNEKKYNQEGQCNLHYSCYLNHYKENIHI
jgi:GR25 family glycosyltransferase involved in LPS biosynthesis